jgi:hypothetical protein
MNRAIGLTLGMILGTCATAIVGAQPETILSVRDNTTDYVQSAGKPDEAAFGEEARYKESRSDDRTPFIKYRQRLFPDSASDPASQKFEQFFGDPYPTPGLQLFKSDDPFADLKKFDDAVEMNAVAGARSDIQSDGTIVRVVLEIPESRDKKVEVYVNDDRILLSIYEDTVPGKYRFPHRQNLSLPKPATADIRSATVDRSGDSVVIYFKQRRDTEATSRGESGEGGAPLGDVRE